MDIKSNAVGKSEDVLVNQADRCLAGALQKTSIEIAAGIIASVLLRKKWPWILGAGIGIGQSWSDCNHELRESVAQSKKVVPVSKGVASTSSMK